jgi:acyl carrier protein
MDMIAEHLEVAREKVDYKSHLVTDLMADSLDLVELVMCFEELLDCEVSDEEVLKMTTVKHVLMYADKNHLSI